jgi:hypothetical protein
VFVLVVFVVDVAVVMLHRLVLVLVFVPLSKVQPDADSHKCCRHAKENGESFLKDHEGEYGSNEGGEREVSTSASGPQVPQGQHEASQAHPVPQQAHSASGQHGRDAR